MWQIPCNRYGKVPILNCYGLKISYRRVFMALFKKKYIHMQALFVVQERAGTMHSKSREFSGWRWV